MSYRCITMPLFGMIGLTLAGLSLAGCGGNDVGKEPTFRLRDTGVSPDASDDVNQDGGGETEDAGPSLPGVPVLGDGKNSLSALTVSTIATGDDGLSGPRDVEFDPRKPDHLWVVNRKDNSVVVVDKPGSDSPSADKYNGLGSSHFMANVTAIAFGKQGFLATAQQTDEKTQQPTPADFMGPSLWPSDPSEFDGGHASHLDMLHNSPLSSGIAWDNTGHAYWVFDGYHQSITRYDFGEPHPPGGSDHSDGVVRRYIEGKVSSKNGVPAHIDIKRQQDASLLYIADTGNNRVAVLETDTGEVGERIYPNYDGGSQRMVTGATVRTLVDGKEVGMETPAGLELHDGKLFVSDHGTSTVYAFDASGQLLDRLDVSGALQGGALMGIDIGPDGALYLASGSGNRVVRIAPQ